MNGPPATGRPFQKRARTSAPEALVGDVVRDRGVLQRQRTVCEQAAALNGDARASGQRVMSDCAVDQGELAGGAASEGAGEDAATLGDPAGAARGARVVPDGGVADFYYGPKRVAEARAASVRRAGARRRRESVAADQAVADGGCVGGASSAAAGGGGAAWRTHGRGVVRDVGVADRLNPGHPVPGGFGACAGWQTGGHGGGDVIRVDDAGAEHERAAVDDPAAEPNCVAETVVRFDMVAADRAVANRCLDAIR